MPRAGFSVDTESYANARRNCSSISSILSCRFWALFLSISTGVKRVRIGGNLRGDRHVQCDGVRKDQLQGHPPPHPDDAPLA